MIRVVLPAHLRALAHCEREISVEAVADRSAAVLDAVERAVPDAAGHHARPAHRRAPAVRPVLRLRGGPVARPTRRRRCRPRSPTGKEPFLVIGAMAGG